MKKCVAGFFLSATSIVCAQADAAGFHVLYGTKLGQAVAMVKKHLGEPDKVLKFEDGWVAYAYKKGSYAVIYEANNTRPDIVFSIQIEGKNNPEGMGLNGVDLGSDAKQAVEKLGAPTLRQAAQDMQTHQPVPNTFVNFYGNNFSFEEKDNKVTSIKVQYDPDPKSANEIDLKQFIALAKKKDVYGLAEAISSALTVNGQAVGERPLVEQITGDTPLNKLLFGKEGIASLTEKNFGEAVIRVTGGDNGSSGVAYQIKDHALKELYFAHSFEGLVLFDVQ